MHYLLTALLLLVSGLSLGQAGSREVTICRETTLRLTAASAGAASYQWYRNDALVETEAGPELVVSDEGTYKAFGVNADGCVSDESVHIVVTFNKPLAVADFGTAIKNKLTTIDVLANDESTCAPLKPATLALDELPEHGQATVSAGSILFDPEKDYTGPDAFTYIVSDANGVVSTRGRVSMDIVSNPMPVVLSYFDATKSESVTRLAWGTSLEVNSDHFSIERSIDARTWTSIAMLPAVPGTTPVSYHFTDSLPEPGVNYYRLKMTDRDSSFTYSSIRSVFFPELSWAELYPNPVTDMLHIVIRNKKVSRVRMISTSGLTLFSQRVSSSDLMISMKNYALGQYMFHFEQSDGAVKVFKIFHN
ncbi:Ig-like domain-containing protein [Dyadobacter sandarakinus]|uniref:Por secretion system C-terminal sorting domain-containing protein n=1 Tax=Dyadobacter sandarakinus TaxID=2747268 RepID=A0ABX7I1X7_9BACT|nr:Ig-like domain-containing protein [Dyadobacter sandarakinus]QRQ99541.1 hypothetical protein HWI92_00735 [Dyadobacter sandarakinus]